MSGIDFSRYQAPGIYTEAVPGPQIPLGSATPTAIGIFGRAQGFRSDVESLRMVPDLDELTGGINAPLRNSGIRTPSIRVTDPYTGDLYAEGDDYEVELLSSTEGEADAIYTIRRVTGGRIPPESIVQISYRYTDPTYFRVRTFYDYSDVQDTYGPAFDSLGNIVSELSLACRLAFINGAQRIIAAPVESTDPDAPALSDYTDALGRLAEERDVSIVVPAADLPGLDEAVEEHVRVQSRAQLERRAIIGVDGTGFPVTSEERAQRAGRLNSDRVAMISPSSFTHLAAEANRPVTIGGQFMAAAVAGLAMTQIPAMPLTRKNVSGFLDIEDPVSTPQRNLETQSGLMVLEVTRRGSIQIRHGVTTAPDTVQSREWTITGQQDAMVYRVREHLGLDGIIGGIISENTLAIVKSSVHSALRTLTSSGVIYDYDALKVRQRVDSPDVVEVSFAWRPSMPLNYLAVTYSVSLESGVVDDVALG